MAEIFDKKLVDEVSRLTGIGKLPSERLAGWDAFTLKASLRFSRGCSVRNRHDVPP